MGLDAEDKEIRFFVIEKFVIEKIYYKFSYYKVVIGMFVISRP